MKKLLLLIAMTWIAGCSDNISDNQKNILTNASNGSLSLSFDKATTPAGVVTVQAVLSRENYSSITKTINVDSDSSAETTFEDIAVGTWSLKVDALGSSNQILYSGNTSVNVVDGITTQVNLVLQQVSTGVGSIKIVVTWGIVDLNKGLVLYYPFNGNALDGSGGGHNGNIENVVLTKDRFGKDSSAYSFNGMNSIIRCGDILDSVFCAPHAKFTISAWANPKIMNSPIVCKSAGGVGPYQWNLTVGDGVGMGQVYTDSKAVNYKQIAKAANVNKWSFFVLTFDGTLPIPDRLKYFVNGESKESYIFKQAGVLGTTTENTTHQVVIGGAYDPLIPSPLAYSFSGAIDEVRIYDRALTNTEIQALYNLHD